jgi:hypothetical protein
VHSALLVGKKLPAGKVKTAPCIDITKSNKYTNLLMMWF